LFNFDRSHDRLKKNKHGTDQHAPASPVIYVDLSAAGYSPDFPTCQSPCTPVMININPRDDFQFTDS